MALNIFAPVARAWNALRAQPPNPQRGSLLQFIGPNDTGIRVTEEIAFQVSAVWACIDVISAAMSSSGWNVYEWIKQGEEEKQLFLYDDSLQYILNTRPNPEMTAQSMKRALMIAAVSWGNGYAEIVRDMAGRVVELWPISPERVEPRRDEETGALFYRVYNDQGTYADRSWVDLEPRDVFHIRGPGMSGLMGDNVIAKAVRTIALAIAQQRFGEAYFGNNTQMGGWLEVPRSMGEAEYERLKKQMEDGRKGVSKAFKFGIFEGGAKWHQADTNAEKAQLTEEKQHQIEEICRWFRVPPHKVAHLLRATNNNIEHQGLEFSRDTLRPWKVEIEQEAEFKLFSRRGKPRFVCVDITWAEQGDYKSRAEAYQVLRNIGVFSANDVLRKLGENTIGPEGDIRIVQGANVRLEDVGAAYEGRQSSPAEHDDDDDTEVMEAWLRSVFSRMQKRQENRRVDLERGGRPDAARQAQLDAMQNMNQALEEVMPLVLERWPGAHNSLAVHALHVIRGAAPAAAAADLIQTLKGKV